MDKFTREWITINALEEIPNYDLGVLTLRALHYRLVARGMTNSLNHYKRVVAAMIQARWEGIVQFETFSDHDRQTLGDTNWEKTDPYTSAEAGKTRINLWMDHYSKNAWENQEHYLEVWIEKKALQGVFGPICEKYSVLLSPCKGYPSLTFLNDAKDRLNEVDSSKKKKILYFGDYDPSGEDIPRSIDDNLHRLGAEVEIERVLLMEDEVVSMGLPPAPAKKTDSRTANWNGLGQVELDAIEPNTLQEILTESILKYRDEDLYSELLEKEQSEKVIYKSILKEYVQGL